MTTRSIAAAAASLAFAGVALVSGPVAAEAPDVAFERLCTAFLGEYVPATEDGASPECHDDNNVTQDRYGDVVNHTMFMAVCGAMGFDGMGQTVSGFGTSQEHWVLSCTFDA